MTRKRVTEIVKLPMGTPRFSQVTPALLNAFEAKKAAGKAAEIGLFERVEITVGKIGLEGLAIPLDEVIPTTLADVVAELLAQRLPVSVRNQALRRHLRKFVPDGQQAGLITLPPQHAIQQIGPLLGRTRKREDANEIREHGQSQPCSHAGLPIVIGRSQFTRSHLNPDLIQGPPTDFDASPGDMDGFGRHRLI